jgi:predicted metal-dependent hydrolase
VAGRLEEPQLSPEDLDAFRRGVAEFNAGYYFECHDTLEEIWSGVRGEPRDFFQGLIQVSVGFYHLNGGNAAGALSMFGRALKRLERYGERYWGFDVAALRREIGGWAERLRSGAPLPLEPQAPPRWVFDWME